MSKLHHLRIACLVFQDDVQGVDNACESWSADSSDMINQLIAWVDMHTGNVSENSEQDVDEEVSAAATLEEDSNWGHEDGEDDLDDVAVRRISS